MIMRGTTPRALSWPGCLTVLAVGAFFLPLLPALHAQAPGKEEPHQDTIIVQINEELEEVQAADLEKAKADLAQREAQLKRSMAEVAKAQAALKAAEARLRASKVKVNEARHIQLKVTELGPKGLAIVADGAKKSAANKDAEKKPMIRIEIIASPDVKHDELKDLIKKLQSLLPNERATIHFKETKEATKNILRVYPVQEQPVIRFVPQVHVQKEHVTTYNKPFTITGPSPAKATTAEKKPGGNPQEKRINELEMKLEKVLKELHELRKQMKESQAGRTPPPSAYFVPAPRPITPPSAPYARPPARPTPPTPPSDDPYDAPTVPLAPDKAPRK